MVLTAALGVVTLRLAQPERRAHLPRAFVPGCAIVLAASVGAVLVIAVHDDAPPPAQGAPSVPPPATRAEVLSLVAQSGSITSVPPDLIPPLSQVSAIANFGAPPGPCWPAQTATTVPACVFGDTTSTRTMVLYGDSHAAMWFDALDAEAKRTHWKLDVVSKGSCPAVDVSVHAPDTQGDWAACDQWHRFALARIAHDHPQLVVVSQASTYGKPDGSGFSPEEWQHDLGTLLASLPGRQVVIGNIPFGGNLDCLLAHPTAVQQCSSSASSVFTPTDQAERQAADAHGAIYVDTTAWFCASRCSVVVGNYSPYYLAEHVAVGYSEFLEGVLAQAIGL